MAIHAWLTKGIKDTKRINSDGFLNLGFINAKGIITAKGNVNRAAIQEKVDFRLPMRGFRGWVKTSENENK